MKRIHTNRLIGLALLRLVSLAVGGLVLAACSNLPLSPAVTDAPLANEQSILAAQAQAAAQANRHGPPRAQAATSCGNQTRLRPARRCQRQ